MQLNQAAAVIITLSYVALVIFVVWQVVSALRRISKGVEDIAESLRRMEAGRSPSSGEAPPPSIEPISS